jgi:6-phosphogluconolactonase (cycloisomerase 2 family)
MCKKPWGLMWHLPVWFGLMAALFFGAFSQSFAASRFVYAANYFGGSISIYRVDAETGLLYHQSHVPTFKSPSALILHPSNKFLFVVSQTIDQIAIYRVDARNGMLTEIADSPVPANVRSAFRLEVSPDGRFLYVPGRFTADLAVFHVNPQTGALTPALEKTLSTHGERARFIETTPNGRFVYVSTTVSNTVAGFTIDPEKTDIQPVAGMPFETGHAPQDAMVHPNGKFLYICNWQDGNISSYAIDDDSGVLTPLPGKPAETGYFPFAGAVHPSGKYLYVANWASSDISSFSINSNTGKLAPLSEKRTSSLGDSAVTVTLDKEGHHAYVPNYGDSSMTVFSIDPENGRLLNPRRIYTRPGVRTLDVLDGPEPVKIESRFMFAADKEKSVINSYVLDERSHTPAMLSRFSMGKAVGALALSPDAKRLYFASASDHSVGTLEVSAKGRLAPLKEGEVKLDGEPRHLRVNARGSHLYVVTQNPSQFIAFAIEDKTGRLQQVEKLALPEESRPSLVVGSPEERLNYVLDTGQDRAFGYRYLYNDGPVNFELTRHGSPFELTTGARDMAISPNGFWALVSSAKGSLSAYSLPGPWGPLKLNHQGPRTVGGDLVDVAIHPKGQWVYLQDAKGRRIVAYRLDGNTGKLEPAGDPLQLEATPRELILDANGDFAYLRYSDRPGLTRYSVQKETGHLSLPIEILPELSPSSVVFSIHIQ